MSNDYIMDRVDISKQRPLSRSSRAIRLDTMSSLSEVASMESTMADYKPMPIDWVAARGFRSFRDLKRLLLGQINLLIGPNGVGKSNLLMLLDFLAAIFNGRLQHYVRKMGGTEHLLHFGSSTTHAIEIEVSLGGGSNSYSVQLELAEGDTLFVSREKAKFSGNRPKREAPFELDARPHSTEATISDIDHAKGQHPALQFVRNHIARWGVFHFDGTTRLATLRSTSTLGRPQPLVPDGSNLATFLYYLKHSHTMAYSQILRTVQVSAPFVKDFVLVPFGEGESSVRLNWAHAESNEVLDASTLSNGIVHLLYLSTLLLQPIHCMPSTILIDEPELSLHPLPLNMVGGLVRSAAAYGPQLILSTQSSSLLDGFDPNHVLVANRVSGETQISRIDQDKVTDFGQDYSLGELWEMNAFGGRP